ncbi:DNA cytosine methyltransferase [Planctomycetota bacterium]
MEKRKPKAIDLFCGCGGLSLGLQQAGFDVLLGIDNDKAALRTFVENHNNPKIIDKDIDDVNTSEIINLIGRQSVDVIVGGPPCQGLSLSGPRKFYDPRNHLFLSYVRIASELKPKAIVLENVPGIASLFKGEIKKAIINEFEKIGYKVSMFLLHAVDYGVPQIRKRVFFVGFKNHKMHFVPPSPTHGENGTLLSKGLESFSTCGDALSDLPPLIDSLGNDTQEYASDPTNTYQKLMRNGSINVYNHIGTDHSDKVKNIISLVPEGGNYKDLPEEYINTRKFNIAWTRYHSGLPAYTVDTGHRHYFHYKYNRVPTVREHARLQSFPDTFIFYGNKGQQNRQVGNAVPPLLGNAVAKELKKCL